MNAFVDRDLSKHVPHALERAEALFESADERRVPISLRVAVIEHVGH